ncbi:MAG: dihydroorotase [Myxococcales bacterium]
MTPTSSKPSDSLGSIEIIRPDDWHLHLREGEMLARVLPYTALQFARAVVMPNLDPPIQTVADAARYREEILAALPASSEFEPLMTLYLTNSTTVDEIVAAAQSPFVVGVKFYPMGATTNSAHGVDGLSGLVPVLECLERTGLPLLVHGESTSKTCDVFDRERVFLNQTLRPMIEDFEGLRVVFEHITTEEAAAFVSESPERIAATITPQHLLLNRNAIFEGGLRPHHYCLPVLKRERDREALVAAATGGGPSFFLGTDSAPHQRTKKESACGCAGIFSAPVAIEAYAEAFHRAGAIAKLEAFASFHGPDYYRRPRNTDRIRLDRSEWKGPDSVGTGDDAVEVFWREQSFQYRLTEPDGAAQT